MLNRIIKLYRSWKHNREVKGLLKLGYVPYPFTKYSISLMYPKRGLYYIYPTPRHNNLPTMYKYNGNGTFSDFSDDSFIIPISKVEMLKHINIPETPKVK
jgi:hypothetical protein